jgi:hypothetical protein
MMRRAKSGRASLTRIRCISHIIRCKEWEINDPEPFEFCGIDFPNASFDERVNDKCSGPAKCGRSGLSLDKFITKDRN